MRFTHGDRRISGIALPLAAVRTGRSPGAGEFPDLAAAGALAESWGFELIQLLPVNDSGSQTSPYSALSAFALHPLYLRLGELPEIGALRAEAEALVDRFGAERLVRHEELLAAKLGLLARVWDAMGDLGPKRSRSAKTKAALRGGAELDDWIAGNPWVREYAAFVELKRRNGGRPWWEWREHRDPTAADIAALWADASISEELRFWAWIQMRAAGQFLAAAEGLAARGIELMGDIPILMNRDSADVWSRRAAFDLELVAGAPPDMYAELGQNWGFPIYDWKRLEAEGYGFWFDRLREADKYYSAYRIDHVLGFFRIWSLGKAEATGYLGRFVPDSHIERGELEALGLDRPRIRWLAEPHIRGDRLAAECGEEGAALAIDVLLDRIGGEELFLFKRSIRGELDIESTAIAAALPERAKAFLKRAWRDRAIYEFETDRFAPAWFHRSSSAWPTLSDSERDALESLFSRKRRESEELWASNGRKLLGALKTAVPMLPCAEDLGAVPDCVPRVLGELGILGLRVLRWTRAWERPGQPFVPLADYPSMTVATPSVHDSSSLREWWEVEADRPMLWSFLGSCLGRDIGPCPQALGPEEAATVLEAIARSGSRFAVYPIQDLIALSTKSRPADPREERINVPGTVDPGNWRYRMPLSLEALAGDEVLAARARRIAAARA